MNSRFFLRYSPWLALVACAALWAQVNQTSDVTRLSGTYEIVGKTDAGPKATARLHIVLINPGSSSLSIRRIGLRDFSHRSPDQVRACALTIPAGGSAESNQEFTVPRLDYESWQRVSRPKLILEILTDSGRRTTEAVPLTRVSTIGKGN